MSSSRILLRNSLSIARPSRVLFNSRIVNSSARLLWTQSPSYNSISKDDSIKKEESAPSKAVQEVSPKIQALVDQISALTLLETASLVTELKTKLNIPDFAMAAPAVATAGSANGAAAVSEEDGESSGAKKESKEKTVFNIKLDSFETKSKPKIIKEVKGLLGLSLVEAKKFVEAAPKLLKENVAKDDADKIKKTLEDLGAKVTLE
ncbi:hypothetical protein TBLA_0B05300 [Henningerozyma blattae CBS 6284]|uniref:Ribosomal protein L7/L12 C-terminal domain-containing protein n=1 Tax=Henningerozyma blattae (strain ATCC 34711 / CBS 6284 / DSM 70876 / NBRC 10599 / NRRL Y-10934 / UCD 77-7) TaxID=1071380 RepID=I2GZ10_HENB6|nr:hypothetical protein TBLA_0B05300 [Tetrapisispora blattae CBS 6284]CCH59362.1 hypothetical protein TBLA_0B05300 [Tetrapisispora blattae CBS 6284]